MCDRRALAVESMVADAFMAQASAKGFVCADDGNMGKGRSYLRITEQDVECLSMLP